MNRAELVRQVAARSRLPLAAADVAVKAALDAVAGALADLEAGGRGDRVGEAVDMVVGALPDAWRRSSRGWAASIRSSAVGRERRNARASVADRVVRRRDPVSWESGGCSQQVPSAGLASGDVESSAVHTAQHCCPVPRKTTGRRQLSRPDAMARAVALVTAVQRNPQRFLSRSEAHTL